MCYGSLGVQASEVINDNGYEFRSHFWSKMSRASPDYELPVYHGFAARIKDLPQDLDMVKAMVVYGPYLKYRAFLLPDNDTKVPVVQQFVQLQFQYQNGTPAKSHPERYEQFRDRLKLAGVLRQIATKVRGYLRQQLQ